ncbi:17209_t:CDS:2 [Cetraspora pellucida]|uniref:17209_t:CDS:1 n=1 Tax=Cetraspora pellucida TaxID=1433469 RepID=A0A9N9DB11_9GLOM|nr:17209_t:CDS:2 [Cetraspora pellucida]
MQTFFFLNLLYLRHLEFLPLTGDDDFQESNKTLENTEQTNKESLLPKNQEQPELDDAKNDAHMALKETDPNHQ